MELRLANLQEARMCYQCIEDARAYHKSLGFEQWHPDYPTEQTILDDIAQNIGYVFVKENEVIGYCCIKIGDEPAYAKIDGAWKTEKPYAVVHRMAFSSRARGGGLSHNAFQLIKDSCRLNCIDAIRLDTQEENKVMQHILSREGLSIAVWSNLMVVQSWHTNGMDRFQFHKQTKAPHFRQIRRWRGAFLML